MQKFEEIIQQAFSKIDAANPKMRQKVYENIWFLQEKALAEQDIDPAIRQERRAALTELLKRAEMRARAQYAAPSASAPSPAPAPRSAPQPASQWPEHPRPADNRMPPEVEIPSPAARNNPHRRAEPARASMPARPQPPRSGQPDAAPALDPVLDAPREAAPRSNYNDESGGLLSRLKAAWAAKRAAKRDRKKARKADKSLRAEPDDNLDPEYAEDGTPIPVPRRKSHLAAYIFTVAFILVCCFTAWTFYNSFGSPESRRARQALVTAPLKQNAYGKNGWTEILNPLSVSGIRVKGSAAAALHKEPDANFIRITTQQPADTAVFSIDGGALQSLRGKNATFKIMARSADDQIGPLRLTADFGGGNQDIYKFELSPTEKPLLFSLDIPQSANGVKFSIGNEAPAGGHEIDIYSILARNSADAAKP